MSVAMTAHLLTNGAFWGVTCGTAVVFGVVSYWLETALIIGATAFIDSYLMVRGVSLYIPKGSYSFPNEFSLAETLKNGGHFNNFFYAYLGGIVLLTISGVIIQQRKLQGASYDRNGKRV